jgi:ATP-dependent DNA ligase
VRLYSAALASIVAKAAAGIRFNEHIEGDGPTVFAHACKMGLEGIVSKPQGARRSGRSPDWLKMKNLAAPAVKGEAEEDWVSGDDGVRARCRVEARPAVVVPANPTLY